MGRELGGKEEYSLSSNGQLHWYIPVSAHPCVWAGRGSMEQDGGWMQGSTQPGSLLKVCSESQSLNQKLLKRNFKLYPHLLC